MSVQVMVNLRAVSKIHALAIVYHRPRGWCARAQCGLSIQIYCQPCWNPTCGLSVEIYCQRICWGPTRGLSQVTTVYHIMKRHSIALFYRMILGTLRAMAPGGQSSGPECSSFCPNKPFQRLCAKIFLGSKWLQAFRAATTARTLSVCVLKRSGPLMRLRR